MVPLIGKKKGYGRTSHNYALTNQLTCYYGLAMVTSLSKRIVSTLHLDGCHDFCATSEGGYLNTAVECSPDSCELQNFIAKLCSANDEKPIVELSVSARA